jgi:hypothetical protein
MNNKQMLSIFCMIVITVCITSIFFLLFDIVRYMNVIEIMINKIFYSMRLILIFILILMISVLFLSRNYK